MTTALLAAADVGDGFSGKTLLTFVGGAILLAFFSSLGILARMRDRRIEQRRSDPPASSNGDPSASRRAVADPPAPVQPPT